MSKHITFITGVFMSALLTIGIAPVALASHHNLPQDDELEYGSMTIYNKNCKTLKGFKKYKRVTVRVFDGRPFMGNCTQAKVTLHIGERKTITLRGGLGKKECKYSHEAMGTVGGKNNVNGTEHLSVTCKKDWAGVCQCTKD